ncbi:hypothetical protein CRUP_003855, partial [Coryphaenoides rupestris]
MRRQHNSRPLKICMVLHPSDQPPKQEGATVSPMKVYDSRSTGWDHAIHSSTNQSNQPPPEHNLISTSRKAETQIGRHSDQPVTQHMDTLHFTRDHMGPTPRNVQGGKMDQCYVHYGANPVNRGPDASDIQNVVGDIEKQIVKKDHRELVEVNVADLEALSCQKVFFVNLIPWKEKDDQAVQVLLCGVLGVLSSCHKQGFDSVAFPMLGTGEVFKFPQHVAESVLLEGITIYMRRQHNSRPLKICMVLHPSDQPPKQAGTLK